MTSEEYMALHGYTEEMLEGWAHEDATSDGVIYHNCTPEEAIKLDEAIRVRTDIELG